jgi:hypothetical protein
MYQGGCNQASAAELKQRTREVPESIDALSREVDLLEMTLTCLLDQLEPVSNFKGVSVGTESPPKPAYASEVAQRVDSITSRVACSRVRIDEAIRDLEV